MKFRRLSIVLFLLLAACNLPALSGCARRDVLCVGLVTSYGGVDDHGLNQSAWEGVQQALDEGLIHRADFIATVDARDRAKNIQTFLLDGYDLVVTVGLGLEEDTRLAADEWPSRGFVGVDQPPGEPRRNLAVVTFPEDQGGFLAGALAALVTQTGKAAALCETKGIHSMWRYCEGFRVGVHYANPDLRGRVMYKEDGSPSELFNDPQWGEKQARYMLDQGVDILFAAGGGTAQAALETAAAGGAYVIGADEDMYYQVKASDFVLSSAVKLAGPAVYALIRQAVFERSLPGEKRGEYALGPYHSLERQVPPSVRERLEQIRRGLADGSIQTGVSSAP